MRRRRRYEAAVVGTRGRRLPSPRRLGAEGRRSSAGGGPIVLKVAGCLHAPILSHRLQRALDILVRDQIEDDDYDRGARGVLAGSQRHRASGSRAASVARRCQTCRSACCVERMVPTGEKDAGEKQQRCRRILSSARTPAPRPGTAAAPVRRTQPEAVSCHDVFLLDVVFVAAPDRSLGSNARSLSSRPASISNVALPTDASHDVEFRSGADRIGPVDSGAEPHLTLMIPSDVPRRAADRLDSEPMLRRQIEQLDRSAARQMVTFLA